MKSLKDYSLNMEEPTYHAYPAWSYSIIARYAKYGFAALQNLFEKVTPTPEMEFGSLFDSMITRGKKTLDLYAVYDGKIPDAEKKVMDSLAKKSNKDEFKDIPITEIQEAADECAYYPRWSFDTKYKHLIPYAEYYSIAKSGKKVVNSEDWQDAYTMMKVFRNDPYLKDLFGTKNTKDVEYLYQTQFVINYTLASGRVAKLKIMPDLIKVDHKEKTIQPVDLKTSGLPAYNFAENFVKMAYYIQAKLYSDVLEVVKNGDDELKEYTILPYLFTDISRTDKIPVTYVYDQTSLSQANGFTFTSSGREYTYRSWQKLLDEILEYQEKDARVPSYISTTEPNDILNLIGYAKNIY